MLLWARPQAQMGFQDKLGDLRPKRGDLGEQARGVLQVEAKNE